MGKGEARVFGSEGSREREIIKTSVIGIIANGFLALFKAVIGVMTNSIAIVLDAVNNLSDAGSSLVTIVGTKLAGRTPDKEHPFGYGRIEYLSAMVISLIILYAGITSFVESVEKILHPQTPDYNAISLIIVAAAVVVKIVLGRYVEGVGHRVNSDSLINSGKDASMDAIISASTLAAALIFIFFDISLEAWLGALISIGIIKAGFDMLKDTVFQILGEKNDPAMARSIKKTVASLPGVQGAYDLVLNNYGPDIWRGSIHVAVPDTFTADQIDKLGRDIQTIVYGKHHVFLATVGIYSVNTKDEEISRIQSRVAKIVMAHKYVKQMHGFYLEKDKKEIRFDVVVSFDAKDRKKVCEDVLDEVRAAFPDYTVRAALDLDFAEV